MARNKRFRNRILGTAFMTGMIAFSMIRSTAFAAESGLYEENDNDKADRTIMMYVCGSNIESDDGNASMHFKEILRTYFSKGESVRYVIMTGGSKKWHMDGALLYDPAADGSIETGISTEYNQIWEAYGADEENEKFRGKMVLLDGDGISGDGEAAKKSEDELMSDPDTLKGFINYAADRYPAEKYDLILCDHGGGPTGGFAVDEFDTEDSTMAYSEIIDAISDNHVIENGSTFDIINFDACLMNTVEYNLALSDYADYYIASPYSIPGTGQEYTGWLNALGKEPDINGYQLGKIIVDEFYDYYMNMEDDGLDHECTLAVVDLKKLMSSGFTDALSELDRLLISQAEDFKLYDEMYAIAESISYVDPCFVDLGNLTSALGVAVLEATDDSEKNEYTELANTFQEILGDTDIIYAKGSQQIKTKERFYRDENGEVTYGVCGTSGMYIYIPSVRQATDSSDYYDAMMKYCSKLSEDDPRRVFFSRHLEVALRYAIINYAGAAVTRVLEKGTLKSEVDYAAVKEYWRLDIDGNKDGEDCPWNSVIRNMVERLGSEKDIKKWLDPIIRKMAKDAVDKEDITAYTVKSSTGTRPRIYFRNVKKQVFDSVDIDVYAELPIAEAYIKEKGWEKYFDSFDPVAFHIGSFEGIMDYEYESWDEYYKWLQGDSCVWDVPVTEKKWHVLRDAEGTLHVADLKKDEFGSAVVCAKGVSLDENGSKGTSQEMKLFFEEGKLISINVRSSKGAYYTVTPSAMKGSMEITLCREVDLNGVGTEYVPISKPFILNAENASKITTDYVDLDEIPDIRDIDGDGDKATYKVVVRDIYGTDVNIQDKVNASAGIMYTGYHDWAKDTKGWKYVRKDGTCLKNSWKKVRGSWYYLGKDGYMEKNAYRGGWYVGQSGAWDGKTKVPGWKKDSKGWWYSLGGSDFLKACWKKIDGKWYYFRKSGTMRTGWILYKGIWYFLKEEGGVATGWNKIKGIWYYFDSDGRMYSNAYIDRKYFVDENGAWDGVTMTDEPVVTDIPGSEPVDPDIEAEDGTTTLAFHQDGWYVARLEVQVWDKSKEDFVWIYSDSCAKGQAMNVKIDTERYEIDRVGYQIWFFGWDNDYMNLPWANTDHSTDFTLSGYGDYPEFTWK